MLNELFRPILIVVLSLLLAPISRAGVKDCSTIEDLSKDLGETWHQGNTSWCHTFTATDAMTRHLLNEDILKPGERLHPLRIGAAIPMLKGNSVTGSTSSPDTMAGNFADLKNSKNISAGLCKETDLSPAKERAKALYNEDWDTANKMWQVNDTDQHEPGAGEPGAGEPCEQKNKFTENVQDFTQRITQDEAKFWEMKFSEKCHITVPKIKSKEWYDPKRQNRINVARKPALANPKLEENFAKTIDAALKSNELAAIGFDANFVRSKKFGPTDSHWSSIVGRKVDESGKCVYIVRNSWGSDCSYYKPEFKCNNGNITVPADQLLRNVHTVQYLTK